MDESREHASVAQSTVAILGGTGDQGRGLAYRLARAGRTVLIGSRSAARAAGSAAEIAAMPGVRATVDGRSNAEAAAAAGIVIVAVPWAGHAATIADLREELVAKVVVDCVNPLAFDAAGPYVPRVAEGSAAEQAAALLPHARVCAAFHHVSAILMADPSAALDQDVLVVGDDRDAVDVVVAIASGIDGLRGVDAGRLRNAHQLEALTANLIAINRRYRVHAGIRVTDL